MSPAAAAAAFWLLRRRSSASSSFCCSIFCSFSFCDFRSTARPGPSFDGTADARRAALCFCDDHCRLWFTDNNSGGSCCPDWRQVCEGVKEGTTCLDARAQGSALGLFVAAAVVT